ncbi:MAG: hypothetical protein E6K53_15655 [Gammaproteobacteria bacterium]|nr:MAG: hypothetical protein E6K53_15655 [Gammaproteobacteria bacterium]
MRSCSNTPPTQASRNVVLLVLRLMLLASLTVTSAALAQGMPGGGMGHGGRGGHSQSQHGAATNKPDAETFRAPNPLRAMLGEMRKLRADLLLDANQLIAWTAMEDALRDCADLSRTREVRSDSADAATDALRYVRDMADNERALSDAMGKFSAAMKSALAKLHPRQLKLTQDHLAAAIDGEVHAATH